MAKNRQISSFLSPAKFIKIAKNQGMSSIFSAVKFVPMAKNGVISSIQFLSQIRENSQKSSKKFTPVWSQICKFIAFWSRIHEMELFLLETDLLQGNKMAYPKHFEKQCQDLKLRMTSHRTVPYCIMLCCVTLSCLVLSFVVLY